MGSDSRSCPSGRLPGSTRYRPKQVYILFVSSHLSPNNIFHSLCSVIRLPRYALHLAPCSSPIQRRALIPHHAHSIAAPCSIPRRVRSSSLHATPPLHLPARRASPKLHAVSHPPHVPGCYWGIAKVLLLPRSTLEGHGRCRHRGRHDA
jgi:hypothetical protein